MTTRVVHCKREKYDVYIGRPEKWGNPFSIGKDGDRDEVIRKYREWIMKQDHLLNDLHELKGRVLGCWCHPKACHGDVLAELADLHKTLNKEQKKELAEMIKSFPKHRGFHW